jgi:PAS domain S-box-containing protein
MPHTILPKPTETQDDLFFALAYSSPAMMWLCDGKGNAKFFNPAWLNFRGRTLEQELGKGWLDGVHPDDKAQFFAEYFCATEKQLPFEAEYRLLRHDGVYRWILEKAAPYYDPQGNFLGYCGSCIDITEQKEQNQKLKLLESAFNASRSSIVITDAANDNAVIYVNPTFEKVTGYSASEVIGKNLRFLQGIDNDQPGLDTLRNAIREGKNCHVTIRNYSKSGAMYWNRLSISPVRDEHGNVTHFVGIQEDVTERVQREALLRRAQTIIDTVSEMVIICDKEANIHFVNESFARLLEYTPEELRHMKPSAFDVNFSEEKWHKAWEIIRQAKTARFEVEYQTKSGKRLMLEAISTYYEEDGQEYIAGFLRDITEIKAAQAKLAETNALLQSILDASPNLTFIYDLKEQRNVLVSQGEYLSDVFPIEAWQGQSLETILAYIHPDDVPIVLNSCSTISALPDKKVYSKEYRVRDKEGKWCTCLERGVVFKRDEDGKPVQILATLIDVTEQRQTAQALRYKEDILSKAERVAHIGAWEVDLQTMNVYWSDETYRIHEVDEHKPITVEEAIQFYAPEAQAIISKAVEQAIKEGKSYDLELPLITAKGTPKWVHAIGYPELKEGKVVRLYGVFQDITERKEFLATLERNRELLQTIFDESPDAIFLVDARTDLILDCNTRAESLFERTKSEMIGKNGGSFHVKPFTEKERAEILEQIKQHGAWGGEIEYLNPTGKRWWGWLSLRVFQLGKHIMLLVRISDITAMRKAQMEKEQLQQQVLHLQKLEALGTLSAGVAHDFNNLLTVIQMANSTLKLKAKSLPIEKYTETIHQTVERGKNIVSQLGLFARSNKAELSPLRLRDVLAQVRSMLSVSMPKNIRIQMQFETERDVIMGNMTNLAQVFLNLAINARDAMPDGGELTFTLSRLTRSEVPSSVQVGSALEYVVVSVRDTGTGMSEEVKARIFEPFFTTKGIGKGTGLGLAIVFGVVQNHNGAIDVQSTLGKGTTFTLYFPASEQAMESETTRREELPRARRGETILLVDDERAILEAMFETLEEFGYDTIATTKPQDALARYQETFAQNPEKIALVISDLGMPDMGGDELIKQILALNPKQKVLVISGYYDEEKRSKLMTLGKVSYLQKPFEVEELVRTVYRALGD